MRNYALSETAALIRRVAEQVDKAAEGVDEDSIHGLRVANRRLSRCLRVFSRFYPDNYWKKIRTRLTELMDRAGAVRDCDIAAALLQEAGIPAESGMVAEFARKRHKAAEELDAEIRRWKDRHYPHKWRRKLDLPAE